MVSRSGSRRDSCSKGNLLTALLCLLLLLLHATAVFSDVEMTGFRIIQETGSGRWEIQAGTAYYDGRGDVILQKVSARMMDNGFERVKVVSDNGRYDSEGLVLHLEGDVIVASAWGSRLETPNLIWDGQRALMLAEGGVQLLRSGWKVTGESVRYTVNSGKAIVDGGVLTTWDERSDQR